jgi:hypothetical protein
MYMDYFQGVVAEYLRADRACFINPEFWLRGNLERKSAYEKPHWFVDVLAIHMKHKCAYLCEVTYAKRPTALLGRLQGWRDHWSVLGQTLRQDTAIPADWDVKPWIFAPAAVLDSVKGSILKLHPAARMSPLEEILPWLYCTWDRKEDLPSEINHPL